MCPVASSIVFVSSEPTSSVNGALCAGGTSVSWRGQQVQHRAGDPPQIDHLPADLHLVLDQEVLLVKMLHEVAKDLARHGHIVVDPGLHREELFDELRVIHAFQQRNRLAQQVPHGTEHREAALQEVGRAVADFVHEGVDVEVLWRRSRG